VFSAADVSQLVGSETFARGEEYVSAGQVVSVARNGDGTTIVGQVRGSARKQYVTVVEMSSAGEQATPRYGRCSCPVRLNCKHTAATLLAYLDRLTAQAILADTEGIDALSVPWGEQKYYAWAQATFRDEPLLIARTGYTGEDGFELLVRADDAAVLWDTLLVAGEPHGLVPAGLAARDTLRLEAGMPLYGHELTTETKPAQAGLGRVVAADKSSFIGKDAVDAAADAPVLVGLVAEGKRAGRAGYGVVDADGTPLGEITSGALSPTLGHPIAMAYVTPSSAEEGTAVFLDVRGTRIPATVTALPFYRRTK